MNIAILTPLLPVRSGVAHYASMLLPELARHHHVTAVVSQSECEPLPGCDLLSYEEFDGSRFDRVICQLGNNSHHEFAYVEAMMRRSVIVLHDFVLHHLIVEATLARGHHEHYVEQVRMSHGASGAALARGRVGGFHGEIGNFLYPASAAVANRSEAVIVHNRYAAESLRRCGVETPVVVVGHPYRPLLRAFDRDEVRRRLGYSAEEIVIGIFGFLTAAKRPEVVLEAFARALSGNDLLRLLIVGEPATNIDVETLASRFDLPRSTWRALGYVADDEFDEYLAAVDKVVNLRYPSAGETSGALIRGFLAGKPIAVSDYAQFAEYPDEIVTKIPFGSSEIDSLREFLLDHSDVTLISSAQKQWLEANGSIDGTVTGYLRALAGENDMPPMPKAADPKLPVLAELQLREAGVQRIADQWHIECQLENVGPSRLEAGVYGQPGYRVLAKVFHDGAEIFDRWIPLPRDLAPGESASIGIDFISSAEPHRLELFHAIEGVPHFEFAPFASAELPA